MAPRWSALEHTWLLQEAVSQSNQVCSEGPPTPSWQGGRPFGAATGCGAAPAEGCTLRGMPSSTDTHTQITPANTHKLMSEILQAYQGFLKVIEGKLPTATDLPNIHVDLSKGMFSDPHAGKD